MNYFLILTFQDKYNKHTLSENIKFICTCWNQDRKTHQRFAYLPVSNARTNKFYIFGQCTYFVYIIFHSLLPVYIYTIVPSKASAYSWIITGFVARVTRRITTSVAGTGYPSGAHELTPGFSGFVLLDL